MIVAMQTGTDFPSYPHSKIGSRGWFFAGNDLSSLFAIMFPIIVLYSIHKTTSFSKYITGFQQYLRCMQVLWSERKSDMAQLLLH